MSIRRVIPLGVFAFLLLLSTAQAGVSVRLVSETTSLFIYRPFTLRLDVVSDTPPEIPKLPTVPDLAVITAGRLPSDQAQRKHSFHYELIAERDGILTVPPIAVRADGETVLTSALRLRIRAPREATEMALAVTIVPATLRVGQPATVTVSWTSTVAFARCKQLLLEFPLLTDTRCRLFPLDPLVPKEEQIGLPVNNIRLVAQTTTEPDDKHSLTFRFTLIPRAPCVLRTAPMRLVCAQLDDEHPPDMPPSYFYNHFFEAADDKEAYDQVYLTTTVPEVTVRGLEPDGRNAHFASIVGPCDLHTSIAPTQLIVGQAALFTVFLEDLAFARHITELPSAAFDGLHPDFQLSAEPIRESTSDHTRSFTHTLRPLRPGITHIPAIVIQAFDPDTGHYKTLRSVPIPISVEPDPEDTSRVVVPRLDSEPLIPLNGIRHNRDNEQTMTTLQQLLEFLGRYWWAIVPLPPLLWIALLPLVRRRERCRRDPVYARATAAWWRFRQTVRHEEETAWRNYLADRLALCAEALTADTVTQSLRAREVDANLIAETRRRFEARDAADYGKRPAALSQSTRNLVQRLHKATIPLMLACCLLIPSQGSATESADAVFAHALQMRTEKPDEAQPLFVEAALRYEAAEQFRNAANSWFFAGENGRALANYRAAQQRWPFDGQLRESIAFLRANRADSFPSPAAPTGRLANAWNQFGTWATELRVGLFVLAYLIAWLAFLTLRLAGWQIRRMALGVALATVFIPLISVTQSSFRPAEGIVIEDTVARLGPGYAYDPSFAQPLHKAAEFSWMETRRGWVRAQFPDASEGWLRESDCQKVQ